MIWIAFKMRVGIEDDWKKMIKFGWLDEVKEVLVCNDFMREAMQQENFRNDKGNCESLYQLAHFILGKLSTVRLVDDG